MIVVTLENCIYYAFGPLSFLKIVINSVFC